MQNMFAQKPQIAPKPLMQPPAKTQAASGAGQYAGLPAAKWAAQKARAARTPPLKAQMQGLRQPPTGGGIQQY